MTYYNSPFLNPPWPVTALFWITYEFIPFLIWNRWKHIKSSFSSLPCILCPVICFCILFPQVGFTAAYCCLIVLYSAPFLIITFPGRDSSNNLHVPLAYGQGLCHKIIDFTHRSHYARAEIIMENCFEFVLKYLSAYCNPGVCTYLELPGLPIVCPHEEILYFL